MHSTVRSAIHSPMFWLLNLIGLAAIGSNLAAGDGAGSGESFPSAATNSRDSVKMIREGARVDSRLMVARLSGETLTLESEDDKQSFEALENLALERVVQAIRADSSDKRWLVTGVVTEYRGRNFLLLERVSRAPRSAQ